MAAIAVTSRTERKSISPTCATRTITEMSA
nr:MAG TPA: hypothetical protein [Caudoviricetes sp.]